MAQKSTLYLVIFSSYQQGEEKTATLKMTAKMVLE